jgi:hypothetical protein
MTIKTVLSKGRIVLQPAKTANCRVLVTATSKGRSRNLADFDPASLLDKKRQKTFTDISK